MSSTRKKSRKGKGNSGALTAINGARQDFDAGLFTPPSSQQDIDATRMLISPPPEETLRVGSRSSSHSRLPFTPSLLLDGESSHASASHRAGSSSGSVAKRKRSTVPTVTFQPPPVDTEATPNPKPRKQSRHHDALESPTRTRFSTTSTTTTTPTRSRASLLLQSPHAANPDADFLPPIPASLSTSRRARKSVTPVPPYEPPSEHFTPPREVLITPRATKSTRRRSGGARPSSGGSAKKVLRVSVKREPPHIDLSRPMPPPSPTDDPLLLSGPPAKPRRFHAKARSAHVEHASPPALNFSVAPSTDDFSMADATGDDILPLFDLSGAVPHSRGGWSSSEHSHSDDSAEEGTGEYTGRFRMMQVPTKVDPPTSGTRGRMDAWGRPVSPFPAVVRGKKGMGMGKKGEGRGKKGLEVREEMDEMDEEGEGEEDGDEAPQDIVDEEERDDDDEVIERETGRAGAAADLNRDVRDGLHDDDLPQDDAEGHDLQDDSLDDNLQEDNLQERDPSEDDLQHDLPTHNLPDEYHSDHIIHDEEPQPEEQSIEIEQPSEEFEVERAEPDIQHGFDDASNEDEEMEEEHPIPVPEEQSIEFEQPSEEFEVERREPDIQQGFDDAYSDEDEEMEENHPIPVPEEQFIEIEQPSEHFEVERREPDIQQEFDDAYGDEDEEMEESAELAADNDDDEDEGYEHDEFDDVGAHDLSISIKGDDDSGDEEAEEERAATPQENDEEEDADDLHPGAESRVQWPALSDDDDAHAPHANYARELSVEEEELIVDRELSRDLESDVEDDNTKRTRHRPRPSEEFWRPAVPTAPLSSSAGRASSSFLSTSAQLSTLQTPAPLPTANVSAAADDDGSSEDDSEDIDPDVIKITSSDPRAAARAAAILKMHDYDCLLRKQQRRRSRLSLDSLPRESRRKTLSGAGITKPLSAARQAKRRRTTLGAVYGDKVIIPGSPATTLPELLHQAEMGLEREETALHHSPIKSATPRAAFKTPRYSAAEEEEDESDRCSWTRGDWKLLDACFTDERLELGAQETDGTESLADADDVRLDNVVERFVELMGGLDAVERRGELWSRDNLLTRARALQKKQRAGHVAPPTPNLRNSVSSRARFVEEVPDFTPLPRRMRSFLQPGPKLPPPETSTPFGNLPRDKSTLHASLLAPRYSHLLEEANAIQNDASQAEPAQVQRPEPEPAAADRQPPPPLERDPPPAPAPSTMGKRVKGFFSSYLPILSSKPAPRATKTARPPRIGLPLPPPEVLEKPRGPVTTPARQPLPRPRHPKELVHLHHAPSPAPVSKIPRISKPPQRLVDLHPAPPPPPPETRPKDIHRPRRSSSVKDLVKTFEELEERQVGAKRTSDLGLKRVKSNGDFRKDARPTWKP
ncbi:hypothetical protein PLICRDRAFT_179487 [Plicaturopsis crispa FD-325 SS-3]|uniref:Uncharacterized protein n=1 Tax=Plicaturopsis crispa FD-325 SS-3 TaxID=944288 RepID=A0A0C9T5T5_PLICR|nr:hypothetical protein PLICRDRAFT_179487 [Plicaturopsis crispa FD-325 SS-3]